MSSYYVDGLLSKYSAATALFPNAERPSCSIGPGGEDYSSARTAAFPPSLSGVYSSIYSHSPPVFASGYIQSPEPAQRSLHPLFPDSCCPPEPGALTSALDKQHRMYPWMRASGKVPRQKGSENIGILASINFWRRAAAAIGVALERIVKVLLRS